MYNQIIRTDLDALAKSHPHGRIIFSCTTDGYDAIHGDTPDWERFADALAWTLRAAKFWKWHESESEVFERFCILCAVDPYLVRTALS